MPKPEAEYEPHHQNTLDCTKEFSEKYNYNAPYLAIVSSHQDPTLAKDITFTNISSASALRPAKTVLSTDVTIRNQNGRAESHYRSWGNKVSFAGNGASKMEKGKEPIIYEADDSESSSNRREDGRENFECISSKGMISTAKRGRIYDSESEKVGKRLKGLYTGNSSFMNWVTSITNGLNRTHDGPLEAFQHLSRDMKGVTYPPISDKERKYTGVSHGTMGFRSIFQAVCHPCNDVRSNKNKYIDHQKERDFLKGTEREKATTVTSCVLRESFNFGPHSSSPASSFNLVDGEKENVSIGPIAIGAHRIAPRENNIEFNDKVLASSTRFNEEVCQVRSSSPAAMDSCVELMAQSRNAFQNSFWITRLSTGVSSPQLKSIQCSNCVDLSAEHKFPFWKLKNIRLSEKPQHNSVSHADSHGSVRIAAEKYESKLQLTISSKYRKRSKLMTSSFSQKLDALKHAKPSKISFKANGFSNVNFKSTAKKKHENQEDHHLQVLHGSTVSDKVNEAIETEIVVCEGIRSRKNESAVCDRRDRVEDAVTSSLSCHLQTTVMDEPKGIFVAIRKLRLSRMDILRWMKSRVSHCNLGGFFLRLRIGKKEKGLGGTGYHVARINGASCQRSISVCVGSSVISVTSSFISNHDFNEDELMTWWFQNLRDGTKMPSYEELYEKIQFRLKFGFL